MAKIIGAFRSIVFLGWLSFALVFTTITASIWAMQMATTVATMSAKAAATAVTHRKQLAKAVAQTKAKAAATAVAHRKQLAKAVAHTKATARLRRAVVAVPFAGVGAIAYFEEQDYREWKEQNTDGTRQQYACDVASLTAEVIDEVLQELPEMVRPSQSTVMKHVPECE